MTPTRIVRLSVHSGEVSHVLSILYPALFARIPHSQKKTKHTKKDLDASDKDVQVATAASLQNLPIDLKEEIIFHLNDLPEKGQTLYYCLGGPSPGHRDLRRLTKICRSWRILVRPRLYRSFDLDQVAVRSVAKLYSLSKDLDTLSLVRRLSVPLVRGGYLYEMETTAPFFSGSGGAEAEEFYLGRIIAACANAYSISCETTDEVAETWQPCLYTLISICSSTTLTCLCTHEGASPDIIHMLGHVIRFAPGLQTIYFAGDRPAWSESDHTTHFQDQNELDAAFQRACEQILLALADADSITRLHLSSAFLPRRSIAQEPAWQSSLSRVCISESRSNPFLSVSTLRSIVSGCEGGSLEKFTTYRRYLLGFRELLQEDDPEDALFRLTVRAPSGPTESDEEDEYDFDVDYSPFLLTDLDALSTVSLKVLSLYGEESAALALHVLSTKPFTALKRLKLRSEVNDLVSLQAIRVILEDRRSIHATWNGIRLEDVDITD